MRPSGRCAASRPRRTWRCRPVRRQSGGLDLAASTFVPALAQVNDQGATIRRIAAWSSFSDEQQELLIGFDQWRLVVRKGETDGGTVEVAHEALFREWTRLKGWLEPERARLEALRSLQVDALTWDRNGRDAAFLNHRDKRLAEATTLAGIDGYRKRLGTVEFDYLAACEAAERLARRRTRRVQALIYVLLVGIIAGLVGWINQAYFKEQWTGTRPCGPTRSRISALRAHGGGRACAEAAGELP